jgi:glyoxylase-like metal-dependent hydrolase (beta-lactamase superfamily II)
MTPLVVSRATVGPLQENSYVVGDPETRDAAIVDPGDEPEAIEALVAARGLVPRFVINTHAHIDHAGAVAALKARYGIPFFLHPGDRRWLEGLATQAAMFGLATPPVPDVDRWLADGDELSVGSRAFRVIHTPGHTPGGCSLFFAADRVLFTGDTLFAGSVGRTDLPGGSWDELEASIREKLFPLGDDVVFHSGHGPASTLGDERRANPFVGERATGR